MDETEMMKQLKDLIEQGRATFYLTEYRAGISEEEILGVLVAKYCSWTGSRIIKTMLSALEDANYHTLGAQIEALINNAKPETPLVEG